MLQYSGKKIAILCNTLAGVGRSIPMAERVNSELLSRGIDHTLFVHDWPATFNGFTDVWIVGGDGTLNYFINKYPEIKLPLVVFNGGTGNDIHWLLYGKISFEEQVNLVLSAAPKSVDAGLCNERLFINGVGIGFEGAIAKALTGKRKRPGKTSFMIAILKKIFFYRSSFYKIASDKFNAESRELIIDVANGKRAGGGFLVAPDAEIDDGLFDVLLIHAMPSLKRFKYLRRIEKGNHSGLRALHHFRTASIIIESNEPISSHLDGEFYSSTRLEIKILKGRFLFCY